MPYVNVPNDLSKIKTKIAFNLTKRQLICFGIGAAIGVPTYLLTRGAIGNTGALFVMLGIMLPAFLMAMYEKDGLPFEKVLRNMINTKFLRPGIRPYRQLLCGGLEDAPQKGLRPLGPDPKCERPAGKPGHLKHSGQHGFSDPAVAGPK